MNSTKPLSFNRLALNGLWTNNQALVALLGLCPLLAVSNSIINSLTLGLLTTLALTLSNGCISLFRKIIPHDVRLPIFVLVIACIVTVLDLLMNAWLYSLYKRLGIFIPLIVTNCAIIGRAEAFASKNQFKAALLDGFFMGIGFTMAIVALGAVREAIGTGHLLQGADMLFGPKAKSWAFEVFPNYPGFLLAILPPGAFMGLGFLIVLKNLIEERRKTNTRPVVLTKRS